MHYTYLKKIYFKYDVLDYFYLGVINYKLLEIESINIVFNEKYKKKELF